MKRPPRIPIPTLSAPPRRNRALSEEELALWESVAKQAKPLRKKHRAAKVEAVSPDMEPPVTAKPPVLPRSLPSASHVRMQKPVAPPLAPLGRRERAQLSRGRKEIEAKLDLHGMTQDRAHRALSGFLHRARHDGMTFVLIITGKGKMGAESERGVLRRQCRNG